jgi:hypothetical protein
MLIDDGFSQRHFSLGLSLVCHAGCVARVFRVACHCKGQQPRESKGSLPEYENKKS